MSGVPSTEMIQRVRAAVIAALKALDEDGFIRESPDGTVKLDGHFDPTAVAIAVITAMREPTEEMTDLLIAPQPLRSLLLDLVDRGVVAEYVWYAMIDAALGKVIR